MGIITIADNDSNSLRTAAPVNGFTGSRDHPRVNFATLDAHLRGRHSEVIRARSHRRGPRAARSDPLRVNTATRVGGPIGPRGAGRNARYTAHLVSILELHHPFAWAGPKEDVAAITSRWAQALGEDDPEKVLPLYADDAALWGTLSPTAPADRTSIAGLFVGAFEGLSGLKVTFGEQLIPRVRHYSGQRLCAITVMADGQS